MCAGSITLFIIGTGISLGTSLSLQVPAIAIPSGMFGGTVIGSIIGYGIGHCITPHNKRTYTAFKFDFGASHDAIRADQNDDTSIAMPLLQGQH